MPFYEGSRFVHSENHMLSYLEWQYNRKYIPFTEYKWTEVNPFPFEVNDTFNPGKKLQLYHFRHASNLAKPKALIFYVHGYGDYGSRYAYMGKHLAK